MEAAPNLYTFHDWRACSTSSRLIQEFSFLAGRSADDDVGGLVWCLEILDLTPAWSLRVSEQPALRRARLLRTFEFYVGRRHTQGVVPRFCEDLLRHAATSESPRPSWSSVFAGVFGDTGATRPLTIAGRPMSFRAVV